ncbi:MAG: magnesium chelatase family protein [Alphaproteobacteria bacterium]
MAIDCLKDIFDHIKGQKPITPTKRTLAQSTRPLSHFDFSDVRGQESAKRAAEIAAAGGHNMLMCGPPGSGKSMIAQRLSSIMPPPSPADMLDISMIHSIAGMMPDSGIISEKPFREPHHTASAVALCGGGLKAKPGEMSLAHKGILFLDELPEFPRQVLETLRQPLETGTITVSRANHHVTYPAKFQLIAAMNPSPCGYLGHPKIPCTSTAKQIQNYRAKLSWPLLDRIDLHVDVASVSIEDMHLPPAKETSADIRKRVTAAHNIQAERYENEIISSNSELYGALLDSACTLDTECQTLIQKAAERYAMSARGYHRILRVARTIADLDGSENLKRPHIAEALAYRYIPYVA